MVTDSSPSLLDDSHINRAAPPGSMRYFALLYTPAELRDAVLALYVIDAEIRESAQSANHDVAHTRLQWWRQEIDRLVNGSAQHPATRTLQSRSNMDRRHYSKLHELVVAADMDLARMTYLNQQELRAYAARSGGAIQELAAQLIAGGTLDETARATANRIGAGIRQTEMIRDLRQDAHDGRLYLPLDELERESLQLEDLRVAQVKPAVKAVLARSAVAATADLTASVADLAPTTKAYLRPLLVLAGLHQRLLQRITARDYDVASQRIELGPVEKPWIAWRAARRT